MLKNLERREDGFTLLEIIVACAIIGVLTATAIPFFGAQRKNAVEATLVSDVRNAAMEMEKQAIFSESGYAPELPDTFFETNGNMVVIDSSISSQYAYCIIGSSPEYEDLFVYYHSDSRKVTKDMKTCGFTPMEEVPSLPVSPDMSLSTPSPTPTATLAPLPAETTAAPEPTAAPATASPTATPTPTPIPTPTATPVASPSATATPTPVAPSPTPTQSAPPVVSPVTKAPAPTGYDDPKRKKYKICHSNGNGLELPLPAILNGHSGHHSEDIIPVIPGQFTGQNWTYQGAAIWKNNCMGMNNKSYMG